MRKFIIAALIAVLPASAHAQQDPDLFPGYSSHGRIIEGAIVCGSLDSAKTAYRMVGPNKAQIHSLGCMGEATCVHCDLDPRFAMVALILPDDVVNVWVRKASMLASN